MRILAVYYFLAYLSFSVILPYNSLFFSDKGFSNTVVGMILSIWALVSVIAQPVMGIINDRLDSPRKILLISTIAAPVLGLGFYYFDNLTAIIAFSVLFSWFQSSAGPISDSIAAGIGIRDGFSFGSVRLWGALSYSLGAFATGFLYEKYGYDKIFFYYLVMNVTVVSVLFLLPKTKPPAVKFTLFEQTKEVVRNKPFLIFVGISMLTTMSTAISFTFLPIYFKELGFDRGLLGSAFAISALVEVPIFWLAVKLSKKIGTYSVLSMGAAVYGFRCLILFVFQDVYLTLAMQVLEGISFALAAGTSVEVVARIAGERNMATLQTIFAAVTWGLGGIIGNTAGGMIVDYVGTPFLYFVLFFLCTSSAVLFASTGKSGRKTQAYSGSYKS